MYGVSKAAPPASCVASHLHHPVFAKFTPWHGLVPPDFIVNFLGVLTRTSYFAPYAEISRAYPVDRCVTADYPQFDEEYFEWIDLLESVAAAHGHFTMIELGAGFGRWTANAAAALRLLGNLPHTFVAVEAEPTHFAWLVEHLADNRIDSESLQLVQAAVAESDGTVGFHLEHNQLNGPGEWYGQYIGGPHSVAAVSLRSLLQPLATVDLIDIDIQGAELQVLSAASQELDQKVKRIHIGTHGHDIEAGLHSLFARLGWQCSYSFPSTASAPTEWGNIVFQDGVQSWLNPSFVDAHQDLVNILAAKLAASRNEGARLWQQLEQQRREHARLLTVTPDSLPGKILLRAGQLRNRLAPLASRRRKLVDSLLKKKSS
jgi:FkbM family methyltransferase